MEAVMLTRSGRALRCGRGRPALRSVPGLRSCRPCAAAAGDQAQRPCISIHAACAQRSHTLRPAAACAHARPLRPPARLSSQRQGPGCAARSAAAPPPPARWPCPDAAPRRRWRGSAGAWWSPPACAICCWTPPAAAMRSYSRCRRRHRRPRSWRPSPAPTRPCCSWRAPPQAPHHAARLPEPCCVQSMSTVHGDALGYHFWGVTAKPCAARRAPGASLACRPAPGMAGAAQLARPSPYPARRRTRWASWWTPRAARRARR